MQLLTFVPYICLNLDIFLLGILSLEYSRPFSSNIFYENELATLYTRQTDGRTDGMVVLDVPVRTPHLWGRTL